MGVVGDLNKYAQFQAAEAMRDAAQNEGGAAGMGAGLGAGMAMGQMMQGAFAGTQQPQAAQPAAQTVPCVSCQKPIPAGSKFCPECGAGQAGSACTECGKPLAPGAKFCPECGAKQG